MLFSEFREYLKRAQSNAKLAESSTTDTGQIPTEELTNKKARKAFEENN